MRRQQVENDVDNFYISWGDLVSLLLVFFVYLFSISEIDIVKFLQVKQAVTNEMSVRTEMIEEGILERIQNEQEQLKEMKKQLDTYIYEHKLQDDFSVDYIHDRIEMNMGNVLLFELGESALKPRAKSLLSTIGDLFQNTGGLIIVEGHTDDIPVNTEQYPSNWELSSARASSVVRYLAAQEVTADRFKVVGHGEHRPLVPNTSRDNRAKNRRVKITLKPELNHLNTNKGEQGG